MKNLDADSFFSNQHQSTSSQENYFLRMKLFITSKKKKQFKCLLTLATKESYFLLDGELYQQVDGVAIVFPLGPTLANIFLCTFL